MNLQTQLRIVITLSFVALLSACGASNTPNASSDFASTGTSTTSSVSKPLATCNKAASSDFAFKLAAQLSGLFYDPSWMNLYLTALPSSFEAQSTYIIFFKGQATSDSVLTYNTTPVPFAMWDTQTNSYLNGGQFYNSLKWSDAASLISGISASAFMSRVIFVLNLQDPSSAYQTLSASIFNISNNSGVEGIQALLPTFYANPADYAVKPTGFTRETVLQNLHPLKGQSGDFASLASSLCQ